MNYEVILERNGFLQKLCSFRTKRDALAYMEDNYAIIENWFDGLEFNKFYTSKLDVTYESDNTSLSLRKLIK